MSARRTPPPPRAPDILFDDGNILAPSPLTREDLPSKGDTSSVSLSPAGEDAPSDDDTSCSSFVWQRRYLANLRGKASESSSLPALIRQCSSLDAPELGASVQVGSLLCVRPGCLEPPTVIDGLAASTKDSQQIQTARPDPPSPFPPGPCRFSTDSQLSSISSGCSSGSFPVEVTVALDHRGGDTVASPEDLQNDPPVLEEGSSPSVEIIRHDHENAPISETQQDNPALDCIGRSPSRAELEAYHSGLQQSPSPCPLLLMRTPISVRDDTSQTSSSQKTDEQHAVGLDRLVPITIPSSSWNSVRDDDSKASTSLGACPEPISPRPNRLESGPLSHGSMGSTEFSCRPGAFAVSGNHNPFDEDDISDDDTTSTTRLPSAVVVTAPLAQSAEAVTLLQRQIQASLEQVVENTRNGSSSDTSRKPPWKNFFGPIFKRGHRHRTASF